ncbi:MAG: hypothetical protein HRU11_11360 [Parvularculaceae bacterium]|nr:hypothetical protein [Parvularculaceae bacterium]
MATFLRDPRFACVEYRAIAGTYGTQEGDYVEGPNVFELGFGQRWHDAHHDRATALLEVTTAVRRTLNAGGDVWIMEGGQSDFTHDVMMEIKGATPGIDLKRFHVVQHSDWNEGTTTPEKLAWVKEQSDYRKIADGNFSTNGTPNYNTPDRADWGRVLADPTVGTLWLEAKTIGERHNGDGYLNPSIAAGGFDFSDTAEASHIFGFQDQADASAFFDAFLGTETQDE